MTCAVGLTAQVAVAESAKLAYAIRFSDYESGSVDDWLRGKGFQFEQDAQRRNLIDLDVADSRLTIEAKRRAFGMMPNEAVNVPEFTYVEIDWGVNKFPEGASYEQGVRNEAIIVFVFLGDERKPSGSLFIPDSPHFIGLFLCHGDDRVNHPYVGSYFKKSGRYVCLNRPAPGQTVTTRFNLREAYRAYFDEEGDDDPAVSGIALGLDTKKAGSGGRTSAFIREIRFFH
ncbi:MAG: DUF3047 domain-containing protein [Pseudomonadota bacterium]|nr:MAG: DUF3047 domain-containing protein [Pseudomonadota bacterium]